MTRQHINGILKHLIILTILLVYGLPDSLANTTPPVKDIRIIIDMSGSMKKNDPLNHRTKAVQLFSEVLPKDVYSGIWTFAAEVNMLIKHGKVNKKWKKSAFSKATKIHSYGLYTNIEKALKKSTYDWYKNEPGKEKHLILLTDGYIDISKNKDKNIQSRKNVITKLLPLFKKNKINIHSIALSEFADHDLLKILSSKTNGSYVVIKKASDLDRYFFKLFQSTAKPDTIPFKGNRFKIDKSISDMTIVLFNSDNPTRVMTPEKKYWSHKDHPENVKWVKSDNYEIVTVSRPIEGAWYVDAPVDPDNKIMIVTNLRLNVNKLPSIMLPGDPMSVNAYMTEDGKIITKENFIKLLSVKSVVREANSITRDILKTSYDGKGTFSSDIDTKKYKNQNVAVITIRGPTFVREFKHEFNVVTEPMLLESKIKDDSIILNAFIDDRVIDRERTNLQLVGREKEQLFSFNKTHWQTVLPASFSGLSIKVIINTVLHNEKPFSQTIETKLPEIIKKPPIAEKVEPKVNKKVAPVITEPEQKPIEKPVEKPKAENSETEEKSFSWVLVFILILVVNLLLIVGGYFIYKKIKSSSNSAPSIDLDEDIEEAEAQKSESTEADINEEIEEIEGLDEIEDLEEIEQTDNNKKDNANES